MDVSGQHALWSLQSVPSTLWTGGCMATILRVCQYVAAKKGFAEDDKPSGVLRRVVSR
jgi:hypothetical protein